jgi:hypothetical protein
MKLLDFARREEESNALSTLARLPVTTHTREELALAPREPSPVLTSTSTSSSARSTPLFL